MSNSKEKQFVPRVNQLDAIHFDRDIVRLLRESLLENLQNLSPVLFNKIKPELDLLVQSAIWLGSIGQQFSTFGQQLLLLSYSHEQLTMSRMCLHFALTVLPLYIKSNSEQRFTNSTWLHKAVTIGENAALILSVLNFFRFLKTGKKPTLVDFFLGLDLISLETKPRAIGYKYMTRELIWGGFMEILGLILPIINFHKVRRLVNSHIFGPFSGRKATERNVKSPQLGLYTNCVYCDERPTLPHHMGCGHVYCYYCLQGNVLTDSEFQCVRCGLMNKEVQPVPYQW